jgi:hypothetical protein
LLLFFKKEVFAYFFPPPPFARHIFFKDILYVTTIAQLPQAATVNASDLLPLSQAGLLYSVSVSQLTAGMEPVINVPSGELLGRHSAGAGGVEAVAVGTGLLLSGGALAATGVDHAGFPVQTALSLSDDVVVSVAGAPGLLPVTALRGLFTAGNGIGIDANGVVTVTVSSVVGPVGPAGPVGAVGAAGAAGPVGPAGAGLNGPAAGNASGSIGSADYVAIWQNGALAWMTYGQFLGGQTISQLPAAGPAGDSDMMLVAQGGSSLSAQGFGAIWTYVQAKLPIYQSGVVELTGNTVLDSTQHNGRILVASAALTLTANFANMGTGFSCTLINLAAGPVTMGTGISSGSGSFILPPGASTDLVGLSYSGGSLVWWSGVVPNAPTITVGTISPPAPNLGFAVSGGVFNDAPTALDYSVDGGATWIVAVSPVITANAYSFNVAGLASGTYSVRVRDHANIAIVGVSNSFTIVAPSVGVNAVPAVIALGQALTVSGAVSPAGSAVQVGLSGSSSTGPTAWLNAVVNGGSWTASLTPIAAGTFYVWAEQTGTTAVQAVSSGVNVVAASLTVTVPATGTVNTALSVAGAVSPAADAVNVQLSAQNASVPSSGWTAASNAGGNFSASLTPASAGTYYVWAQDAATGVSTVSSAITVWAAPALVFGFNNPGGTYVHGVSTIPMNGPITPAQNVATQVALSTSNTVPPLSGWQAASVIYGNALWAIYYTTPAVAGNYYVWVESAAGGNAAVSSFTVTVT